MYDFILLVLAAFIISLGFGMLHNGQKGAQAVTKFWVTWGIRKPTAWFLNLIGNAFKGTAKTVGGQKKKK